MIGFGNQTVTFIGRAPTGSPDALGTTTLAETRTAVSGCRHRPTVPQAGVGGGMARAEEEAEVGVSVATEWWQSTCPPHPAAMAAQPSDVLEVGGVRYLIIGGVHVFTDFSGQPFKVTVISERQSTG